MSIDLDRAATFMTTHARVLDRRRFESITGRDSFAPEAIVRALEAYRNADGGYGWGLEPDLRAPESQPAGALHAFEALADAGPTTSPHVDSLLEWLDSASLPDGGLPFALPMAEAAGCAPFWATADPSASSLQITAAVAAQAHRVARYDERVRMHPWLEAATAYCFAAIETMKEAPAAYVLSFALQLLDAAVDTRPEADALLERLARFVPADGAISVAGGVDGETLHCLDFSPTPGRPVRRLLSPDAVDRDLDRLELGQADDGGWSVDFASFSPAATLEWRGRATVEAVSLLRAHGRLG